MFFSFLPGRRGKSGDRFLLPIITLIVALFLPGCSLFQFMQQAIPLEKEGEAARPELSLEKERCKDPALASNYHRDLSLKLVHGNEVIPVKPGSHITISDTRFALLFNMADYDLFCDRYAAARVMASENADFIENIVTPPFEIGDTSYLGAGWSMATASCCS